MVKSRIIFVIVILGLAIGIYRFYDNLKKPVATPGLVQESYHINQAYITSFNPFATDSYQIITHKGDLTKGGELFADKVLVLNTSLDNITKKGQAINYSYLNSNKATYQFPNIKFYDGAHLYNFATNGTWQQVIFQSAKLNLDTGLVKGRTPTLLFGNNFKSYANGFDYNYKTDYLNLSGNVHSYFLVPQDANAKK